MHPVKSKWTCSHVFKVGDVVECIDDSLHDPNRTPWLQRGKIYRITWTGSHRAAGHMVNIDQDADWFMYQWAWEAERFRHLDEGGDKEVLRRIRTARPKRDMVPA